MRTFDVTIRATVTKTLRVEAEDRGKATIQAHEEFSTECDGQENYEQETLDIEEVQHERHKTKATH
jgi:hypothetical protein